MRSQEDRRDDFWRDSCKCKCICISAAYNVYKRLWWCLFRSLIATRRMQLNCLMASNNKLYLQKASPSCSSSSSISTCSWRMIVADYERVCDTWQPHQQQQDTRVSDDIRPARCCERRDWRNSMTKQRVVFYLPSWLGMLLLHQTSIQYKSIKNPIFEVSLFLPAPLLLYASTLLLHNQLCNPESMHTYWVDASSDIN